eukprot:CAMPEP_0197828404 /NCGR_PEP_ID=MMETSP1437-20131217/4971_1 /TAXON_ID=49252 ORGANISM="Eucampia antarctica, Strain CCMP1452" /NCGR_SAMPLE_ID=MMETSP1437 /ASSEMBLY_ACC=CAM_ASM_001096 /LENGTH=245 /DNA_ID=CAMNT_0043429595 /DNA_START=90 /DNA_END=828 /DNA_ORIENTATION=+
MEGGFLPWKIQKVNSSRGPSGDYSNIRCHLPDVPKGMKWLRNEETREWSVVPEHQKDAMDKVQDAIPLDENGIVHNAISVEDDESVQKGVISSSSSPNDLVFAEHRVESTDTFQGICLKYSVNPTSLRQINQFSGTNLNLAPEILLIPITSYTGKSNSHTVPRVSESKDSKIHAVITGCKIRVTRNEAKAYLEMNDNNVEAAIENYIEDIEWDRREGSKIPTGSNVEEADGSLEKEVFVFLIFQA